MRWKEYTSDEQKARRKHKEKKGSFFLYSIPREDLFPARESDPLIQF